MSWGLADLVSLSFTWNSSLVRWFVTLGGGVTVVIVFDEVEGLLSVYSSYDGSSISILMIGVDCSCFSSFRCSTPVSVLPRTAEGDVSEGTVVEIAVFTEDEIDDGDETVTLSTCGVARMVGVTTVGNEEDVDLLSCVICIRAPGTVTCELRKEI